MRQDNVNKADDQPAIQSPEGDATAIRSSGSIPFIRLSITGVFMGLANLVPGVSGGTMVLALGLYEEFIQAFSDLTRLRLSLRAIVVVGMLFGVSALTIFGLAGVVQFLMEAFLPGMLALFIGMTLGGSPMLYKEMKPVGPQSLISGGIAFVLMGLLAFVFEPGMGTPGFFMLFVGGVAGSAAMILPGISGSYILLILGLYLPIIGGVSAFKDALSARDMAQAFDIGWSILLPVGVGVVVGLMILSNLLKFLLKRYHRVTIGFLMGLLLGSVLGLYPFKETRFNKLPRYAVDGELRVLGAGWEANESWSVYRNLKKLEPAVSVRVLSAASDAVLDDSTLDQATSASAVIIAYDTDVSAAFRRAIRTADPKIELLIVPNTEFSVPKVFMVLGLMGIGFFITFLLGRMGPEGRDSKA